MSAPTPRPYQHDLLAALKTAQSRGDSRALVEMATGMGKSYAMAWHVQPTLKAGGKVLYLAHTRNILETAERHFRQVLGDDARFGRLYAGQLPDHDAQVTFASFQSMVRWREAFHRSEFELDVVDEAHHSQADSYRLTLDYFTPKFRVGVTATPERQDDRDIREIFGQPVFSLPLEEAIAQDRWLARVDYRMLLDHRVDRSLLGDGSIATRGDLARRIFLDTAEPAFRNGERNGDILDSIQKEIDAKNISSPRVLIFAPDVAFAEHFASDMRDRKWTAAAVHADTETLSPNDRNYLTDSFHSGLMSAVVTRDVFNEGVDVPEANVVVFLRSTQSETVFLQQLGRGLRRIDGVKERVLVLDFAASVERYEFAKRLSDRVGKAIELRGGQGSGGRQTTSFRFEAFDRDIVELLARARHRVTPFEVKLKVLDEFIGREGHARVPATHVENVGGTEWRLGVFVSNWRLHPTHLTVEERSQLESRSFEWTIRRKVSFEDKLEALDAFIEREGHPSVPQDHAEIVDGDPLPLGSWVRHWRNVRSSLPEAQREALETRGFAWALRQKFGFETTLAALDQFRLREGHVRVPTRHVESVDGRNVPLGHTLGRWRRAPGRLTAAQREALTDRSVMLEAQHPPSVELKLRALDAFIEREGHPVVPLKHVEEIDGVVVNLGDTVGRWRNKQSELPAELARALEIRNFVWSPQAVIFERQLAALRQYVAREGSSTMSARHVEALEGEEIRLGNRVSYWRHRQNKGQLPPDMVEALTSIDSKFFEERPLTEVKRAAGSSARKSGRPTPGYVADVAFIL